MDPIEPFSFGRCKGLFGAFHPAGGVAPRRHGLLVAGPLLGESARAHLVLREVASRCARGGVDVLRFDFAGTGNSAGDAGARSPRRWAENIGEAADELLAVSGCETMTVLAVRFAAHLACSLTERPEVQRLVMWDPLLSGAQWHESLCASRDTLPDRLRQLVADDDFEYEGHVVPQGFVDELLHCAAPDTIRATTTAVLSEGSAPRETLSALLDDVEAITVDCQWDGYSSSVIFNTALIELLCSQVQ